MIANAVKTLWIRTRVIIQMNSTNIIYMNVKCERCGSESQLMMHSIRSNSLICPVCLGSEINCHYRVTKPEMQIHRDTDNTTHSVYHYVSNPVALSVN